MIGSDGYPRHIVCACALVRRDDGTVLVIRSPRRGWELPGGQVECGESVLDGLAREVDEETGLSIAIERLVGVYTCITAPTKLILSFVGRPCGGDLRPSAESPELAWMQPSHALAAITHAPTSMRMRDLLAPPGQPVFRSYTIDPFCELR